MIVMFAMLCDVLADDGLYCGLKSDEYTSWPTCEQCGADCCPHHTQPNTVRDNDGRLSCVCTRCDTEPIQMTLPVLAHDLQR